MNKVFVNIGLSLDGHIPGGHPNSPSDGHFKIPHLKA